jgi:hypothetical protein
MLVLAASEKCCPSNCLHFEFIRRAAQAKSNTASDSSNTHPPLPGERAPRSSCISSGLSRRNTCLFPPSKQLSVPRARPQPHGGLARQPSHGSSLQFPSLNIQRCVSGTPMSMNFSWMTSAHGWRPRLVAALYLPFLRSRGCRRLRITAGPTSKSSETASSSFASSETTALPRTLGSSDCTHGLGD